MREDASTAGRTEVAIVGAGFGGICMGAALRRAGIPFTIFEKGERVGGVWRDNTYPGAACDVPSHLYSFSFDPRPDWPHKYAHQDAIERYLEDCARRHGLLAHIRLGTEVTEVAFDEASGAWSVLLAGGERVAARAVVMATGQLSRPSIPRIPGLESFPGTAFHSARWRHDHDLSGRRVAVVGTGASAIQFVPEIVSEVGQLKLFQRSAPYVIPKRDRAYTALERRLYARLPWLLTLSRARLYAAHESRAIAFIDRRWMKPVELRFERHLRRQVPDPRLREALRPDYPMGCKRILISNDWYPALQHDSVELITESLAEIRGSRLVDSGGREHEVDTIVFGTGFKAGELLAPIAVRGLGGRPLEEAWRDGAEAHLGICVAGFPNLFVLYGPNTNLGHNSIVYMIESQVRWTMQALEHLRATGTAWVDVREEVQREFARDVHEQLAESVWAAGCTSWYLTPGGKNVNNWPGYTFRYRARTRRFDASEFRHTPAAAARGGWNGTLDRHRGGAGEPLVLVHGVGSSWRAWAPVLPALEREHEVLALDLPGFGVAAPLPQGTLPSVPALADAVERALDAAGVGSAHVAGNSMGGWIALELARRGRARSVAALSPAGLGTRRENAFARASLLNARRVARAIEPAADRLVRPAPVRALLHSQFVARPARLAPAEAAYAVRALARSPAFTAAVDWLFSHRAEGLDEVGCPVTIAWGDRDRLLLPRQAERFAARIPGARLVRLAGLGHVPMSDDPAAVAETILAATAAASATPAAAAR